MLTFQILDGGETFYCPLEGPSLSIGSHPDADIRLTERGVAPWHARIEEVTSKGRGRGYKLVDLESDEGTRVNGDPIVQVRLRLGDRVEIGRAVLVLGQRVARRATPADVVEEGQSARARRARRRSQPSSLSGAMVAVAAVVVISIAGVAWWLGGDDTPPASYHEQATLRQAGRFDRADRLLKRLRTDWASTSDSRRAVLDGARSRLTGTSEATAELRARMAREAPTRSFAEQVAELKAMENADPPALAEAARILRREIIDLRQTAIADHERHLAQQPRQPEQQAKPVEESTAEPDEIAGEPELAAVLESVEQLTEAGQYAQALETLRQAMATTAAEHASPLRDRMAVQRQLTRTEMARLIEEARVTARRGDLDEAITTLRAHATRFPTSGSLAAIAREVEALEGETGPNVAATQRRAASASGAGPAASARPDPGAAARRRASIGIVADLMDQVRTAEGNGDFAGAEALLRDASQRLDERDPAFAARLRGQAADMHHLAALTSMVDTRLGAGRQAQVALPRGGVGRIRGVRQHVLEVETDDGMRDLGWPDLPAQGVYELVDNLAGGPGALLGAAVLAYRNGEGELAESCLAQALRDAPELEPEVWGVLRRGRIEPPDPDGYELVKGVFVGRRVIAAQKLAAQLERRVAAALRGDAAAREKLVEELLAQGPQALEGLVVALSQTQASLAEQLAEHRFKSKVYGRLAAQRDELDRVRDHAVALIYDEEKYFYPYKPPAVTSEKAATYWPVQREVDERVAAVRELWNANGAGARIPKALRDDLQRFQWTTEMLAQFAEYHPDVEERAAWVLTLPDARELNLHNFCKTAAEREAWALYERIEEFNRLQCEQLPAAEARQIEVTNAYRRMFGHRPVAVNIKVQEAARGHCEEMSTLGYFGHFSPTPGRRTPFDRMKLAGYSFGASENCAINGSAVGAHDSWLHSSGHHRNLLAPSHTEFGSSNAGRYWTQNFGAGDDYLQNPTFPK